MSFFVPSSSHSFLLSHPNATITICLFSLTPPCPNPSLPPSLLYTVSPPKTVPLSPFHSFSLLIKHFLVLFPLQICSLTLFLSIPPSFSPKSWLLFFLPYIPPSFLSYSVLVLPDNRLRYVICVSRNKLCKFIHFYLRVFLFSLSLSSSRDPFFVLLLYLLFLSYFHFFFRYLPLLSHLIICLFCPPNFSSILFLHLFPSFPVLIFHLLSAPFSPSTFIYLSCLSPLLSLPLSSFFPFSPPGSSIILFPFLISLYFLCHSSLLPPSITSSQYFFSLPLFFPPPATSGLEAESGRRGGSSSHGDGNHSSSSGGGGSSSSGGAAHFRSPWQQSVNVFGSWSRPECVEELHQQAQLNLQSLLQGKDG